MRKPMRKVRRTIQRIDIPADLPLHPLARAFLAVHPVLGKHLSQPRPDQPLYGPVRYRHQVHIALVFGRHALSKELAQTRPCLPRNLRGLRRPLHLAQTAPGSRLTHSLAFAPPMAADPSPPARGPRRFPASVIVSI